MIKDYKKQSGHVPSSSRGFTLIETFVAITILVITVLGPMSLLSRALQDSRFIKDQMTASFLAQEGVELAIDDRNGDGDKYNKTGTINDLLYTCSQFYWHTGTGFDCSPGGGTATNYGREVKVDQIDLPVGGNQYRITSTASYMAGTVTKYITSSTIIFAY